MDEVRCQCLAESLLIQCRQPVTQEDLLCDVCRTSPMCIAQRAALAARRASPVPPA